MRSLIQPRGVWVVWILLFSSIGGFAQTPFKKGVNLTNWFQASAAGEIQFSKFTKKDFERIKSLGCDIIRLPINLHAMTTGAPDYSLDPLFLSFLDKAVGWAEELEINLILDNHTFDPAQNTAPDIGPVLIKVWTQMADHYKLRSKYIMYEVLNEPHGIDDATWSAIQQNVIDAIRTKDPAHYIVVGPAAWNGYTNLKNLPVYTDSKLIYTFHFYDPFIFTHQGASWTDPSMVPLSGVPFPYRSGGVPAVPNSLKGSWLESSLNNYANEGTISKVKSLIDIAVAFRDQRNVPVFCGEFGVYKPNSNNDDRVAWYETVRKYFEEKNIPWTIWDYKGSFGLFEKGTNELFDYDLNVPLLKALGMTVPTQKVFKKKPQTTGFIIYDDFIGEDIVNISYQVNGVLNFYSDTSPKVDEYCIYWTASDRYSSVAFDFQPDLDLSLLKINDHVIKFWVKGNSPTAKFDIRFIDTKSDATDHPWRMGKTIEQIIPADMSWHEVSIALHDLEEKGSWDNTWFNPEGKFDWTAVDKFEIVAEQHDLKNVELWFDQIRIFGDEVPYEEEPVTSITPEKSLLNFRVLPNPLTDRGTIYFSLQKTNPVNISVYAMTGQRISSIDFVSALAGDHSVEWNSLGSDGGSCPPGLYLVKLKTSQQVLTKKVMKIQ